jgi:hypothetical protein
MNNKKKCFKSMKHKKNLIKSAKARVTGSIPYCHGKADVINSLQRGTIDIILNPLVLFF